MYIGIDLGNKRVGIARSQEGIAFAVDIIPRIDIIKQLKKILVETPDVRGIVVGLPYDLYGVETTQLEKTQKFIQKLGNIFPDISIIGHDERYSTQCVRGETGDHRDDLSAQYILQSFLDSNS